MEEKEYVKKSKVREKLNGEKECRTGGSVYQKLNQRIDELLEEAVERAEKNNRLTVMGRDL